MNPPVSNLILSKCMIEFSVPAKERVGRKVTKFIVQDDYANTIPNKNINDYDFNVVWHTIQTVTKGGKGENGILQ